jgi:hypothetical protein
LVVVPQVGWAGFGELGRVGWGTAVWRGRGFGRETAVFASPLPGKAGADVFGKVIWGRWRVFSLWRGLVGKGFGSCERVSRERPVLSTRVMEGKRPFSIKLSGNSQRHFQRSQSASAQRFNNFTQASRPRRRSGVPPNTPSSRRWRDTSDGLLLGDWQRLWSTAPARLMVALVGPLLRRFFKVWVLVLFQNAGWLSW